jgi:hypothetical protein
MNCSEKRVTKECKVLDGRAVLTTELEMVRLSQCVLRAASSCERRTTRSLP